MSPLETLGFALGTSFASGLNLYATVAAAGLLQRFGVVHLPTQLEVLANPIVMGFALVLFVIEFIADKIPYVDSVWDAVHTFIRPPAAAFLSYSAFAGGVPEEWRVAAALLAGTVALTSHSAKATTRAAANVESRALQQLDAEPGRGFRRRISGMDGGGASARHGGYRRRAGDSCGSADLEVLPVLPAGLGSASPADQPLTESRPNPPAHAQAQPPRG